MYVRRGLSRARGLGSSSVASTIAAAITRQENTNPSYNNPGGLVSGPGQTGTAPNGIAIFPDAATGQADEIALVQSYIDQGYSISELINKWAPAPSAACGGMCTGNQPTVYSQNVATWTGLDPTVPLNTLDAGAGAIPAVDLSQLGTGFDLSSITGGIDLSSVDWSTVIPVVLILGLTVLLFARK